MTEFNLELPAAFNLITLDEVDDLRRHIAEIAANGAEEGTLIWAQHQTNARARLNQPWFCAQEDLHCGLILRPKFSLEQYGELFLVAMISMGNALATHLTAMTALSYKWPNGLCIAKHKVAGIWIDAGIDKNNPWLTITSSVNIRHSPEDFEIAAMSIAEAEGTTDLTAKVLLETYARQFITQINNWSDQTIDSVSRQWMLRSEGLSESFSIDLENRQVMGTLDSFREDGSVDIRIDDDAVVRLSLNDFVNWIN